MDIYKILLLLFISFFIYEYVRHGLTRKLVKYVLILVAVIFILMILSNYMDIGNIFAKESTLTTTGAAIIDTTKDTIDKIDFASLFNKASEFVTGAADRIGDAIQNR